MRTLAVLCLWLCLVGTAQAYCRTHTMDPAPSTCPDSCQSLGLPVAWATPQLSYAFNVRGFPGIADADLRRIIAESIGSWEAASCGGVPVEIDSVPNSLPTELGLGPKSDEPNENAIVYLSTSEWQANELGSAAYATTYVWFDTKTGEIIGADMMFNDTMGPFGECPESGCLDAGPRVDIRNVATHEFGHFLGLAHSEVAGSTMYCNAVPRETSKRMLSADDIAGLCAIYPPGQAFAPAKNSKNDAGCALGAEASGGWALLALLLARRRVRAALEVVRSGLSR